VKRAAQQAFKAPKQVAKKVAPVATRKIKVAASNLQTGTKRVGGGTQKVGTRRVGGGAPFVCPAHTRYTQGVLLDGTDGEWWLRLG